MIQHHKWSLTEIEDMMPYERDIYTSLLNAYIEEENEKIRQQTGSSGGLRVERTANRIKLFEAGRKIKTFKFNPGGTGSKAFIKSVRGQELLQELINDVNKSLNPEFVSDEYNTTVEN